MTDSLHLKNNRQKFFIKKLNEFSQENAIEVNEEADYYSEKPSFFEDLENDVREKNTSTFPVFKKVNDKNIVDYFFKDLVFLSNKDVLNLINSLDDFNVFWSAFSTVAENIKMPKKVYGFVGNDNYGVISSTSFLDFVNKKVQLFSSILDKFMSNPTTFVNIYVTLSDVKDGLVKSFFEKSAFNMWMSSFYVKENFNNSRHISFFMDNIEIALIPLKKMGKTRLVKEIVNSSPEDVYVRVGKVLSKKIESNGGLLGNSFWKDMMDIVAFVDGFNRESVDIKKRLFGECDLLKVVKAKSVMVNDYPFSAYAFNIFYIFGDNTLTPYVILSKEMVTSGVWEIEKAQIYFKKYLKSLNNVPVKVNLTVLEDCFILDLIADMNSLFMAYNSIAGYFFSEYKSTHLDSVSTIKGQKTKSVFYFFRELFLKMEDLLMQAEGSSRIPSKFGIDMGSYKNIANVLVEVKCFCDENTLEFPNKSFLNLIRFLVEDNDVIVFLYSKNKKIKNDGSFKTLELLKTKLKRLRVENLIKDLDDDKRLGVQKMFFPKENFRFSIYGGGTVEFIGSVPDRKPQNHVKVDDTVVEIDLDLDTLWGANNFDFCFKPEIVHKLSDIAKIVKNGRIFLENFESFTEDDDFIKNRVNVYILDLLDNYKKRSKVKVSISKISDVVDDLSLDDSLMKNLQIIEKQVQHCLDNIAAAYKEQFLFEINRDSKFMEMRFPNVFNR